MNKLSYIWTKGTEVKEFSTYPELKEHMSKNGGNFKEKYTPIKKDPEWTISEKRRALYNA